MHEWPDNFLDSWMERAPDYPTKALLYMLKQLYAEQEVRLEAYQGQLEGTLWRHTSPKVRNINNNE